MKTKTIKIKKKGGGTRLQKVQVLASGKYKFMKMKGSKKKARSTTSSKSKKSKSLKLKTIKRKVVRKVAKKKKQSHKKSLVTKLRALVYVIAIAAPAVDQVAKHGFTKVAAQRIAQTYTGRDHNGNLSWESAKNAWGPLAVVATADTIASKVGVYKRIGTVLA